MRTLPSLGAVTQALVLLSLLGTPPRLAAQDAVVHAVLFYSPTCPHCHEVINNVLPPLRQRYGERLVIAGIDVTTQVGGELYQATVAYFEIPDSRLGVPTLVVGTDVMVGSDEVPRRFPGIIERGLAAEGIDWPPVPEVRRVLAEEGMLEDRRAAPSREEAAAGRADSAPPIPSRDTSAATVPPRDTAPMAQAPPAATAPAQQTPPQTPAGSHADTTSAAPAAEASSGRPALSELGADTALTLEPAGAVDLFLRDPVGNGVAVAVLIGLVVALAWSVAAVVRPGTAMPRLPVWLFPTFGVAGIAIAAYLSFVEVTGTTAVCGPVGDCNAVQQSPWARLFGIPVGILGLAGYLALLGAWAAAGWGPAALRPPARRAAWGMALLGTAFSAWLTFLEPFVIGATCAWCVSSALVMGLMLLEATARSATPPPA